MIKIAFHGSLFITLDVSLKIANVFITLLKLQERILIHFLLYMQKLISELSTYISMEDGKDFIMCYL